MHPKKNQDNLHYVAASAVLIMIMIAAAVIGLEVMTVIVHAKDALSASLAR